MGGVLSNVEGFLEVMLTVNSDVEGCVEEIWSVFIKVEEYPEVMYLTSVLFGDTV